jgi:hypothetical protein
MGLLAIIILIVAGVVVLSIARGFVLSYLWQWFVVPFGLPNIGVAHAIGISLIVSFLTYEGAKTDNKDVAEAISGPVIQLVVVFAFGWLVHAIMAA